MTQTDKEIEDELRKIFWPHPFDDGSKPLQIITTGDTEKLFVNSYSIVIGKLRSLITQARLDGELAGRIDELGQLLEPLWPGDDYTLDMPLLSGDPWQVTIAKRIEALQKNNQAKQKGDE